MQDRPWSTSGWLVASLPLQPRKAVKQARTKTQARTFFFLLGLLKGGNARGKGRWRAAERWSWDWTERKGVLQWEGGFGEPLWHGRGRGLFSGMLEVPQAIQTPQLNSALDCQLWSTRRTDAFAEQENGLLERCCAMQSRMQDAKCEMRNARNRGDFERGGKRVAQGPVQVARSAGTGTGTGTTVGC